MTTETINGLHSCKPGNDPVIGQVKLFVIENRKGKSGKPYIKIRSANAENGGTPHRVLGAEKTDFVDQHGNISFNLEIEASSSPPSTVQNLRATMHQGEPKMVQGVEKQFPPQRDIKGGAMDSDWPDATPQSPVHAQQGEDGVMATRKHLMQVANLYALCVRCANSHVIADEIPFAHKTNEQFQSTLASIWIEASGRRSTDGVMWWSFIDKMPTTPLAPNDKKHVQAPVSQKEPYEPFHPGEDLEVPF